MVAQVRWLRRIGIQRNSECQTGIQVRLSIDGVPRQLKVGIYIIQGDLAVWLVWTEKQAHNGYLERTVVEGIDPHGCARRHHGGI